MPGGRPTSGTESKHLLTGLAVCGACNGSMIVRSRDYKTRGRRYLYHCANSFLRGRTVYTNNLEAPMDLADREVLDAIKQDLLRPPVVRAALRKALERLQPSTDATDVAAEGLKKELARIDAEIGRFTAAIGSGGNLPSLIEALRERERRRGHIRDQLTGSEQARTLSQADATHLEAELRDRLADWRGLLQRHPREARQILRKLLVGRLKCEPLDDAGSADTA